MFTHAQKINDYLFGGTDMLNKLRNTNDSMEQPSFFKSLRKIKEYDRIELGAPIEQITNELNKFNPILNDTNPITKYGTVLPEYVLKYSSGFSYGGSSFNTVCFAYINEAEGVIECYNYETVTGIYYCVFRLEGDMTNFTYKMPKATDKECMIALAQIISVIGYIEDKMFSTKTVVKTVRAPRTGSTGSAGSTKSSPQKRTVRVLNADKVVYSVVTTKTGMAQSIRKYQRHKSSWTVAGHPRKLPNGTVTWVRPYKKGEGKLEPKTYLVK